MSRATRHLGPAEIAAYRQRTLQPADLVDVSDHLTRCEACRAQLTPPGALGDGVAGLRAGLEASVETLDDHPEPDAITRFVDGTLDDVEREIVASHLDVCQRCADDVADLQAVRGDLSALAQSPPVPRAQQWKHIAAAALAAGIAGLGVWAVVQQRAEDPPRSADATPTPPAQTTPPATVIATIRDGGGIVTVHADGRIDGLPAALASEDAAAVRRALTESRLAIPAPIADLGGRTGTLMSGDRPEMAFAPRRPLATAVSDDQPTFEWTALPGATAYVVSVFRPDFTKVAESGRLGGTTWTVGVPLTRGETYLWQVRASRPGASDLVAPAPPAPEARFYVLGSADAERVAALRTQFAASPLTLGVLLAEAGLLDEAEDAFSRLAAANGDEARVQALLAAVRQRFAGGSR